MAVFPEVDYAKQRGEIVNPAYDYSSMSNPPTPSSPNLGGFAGGQNPTYTSTYSSGGSSSSGSGAGAFVILVVLCCMFGASGIVYFFGAGLALLAFAIACSLLIALVQFGWEVLKWILSWKGLALGTVLFVLAVIGKLNETPATSQQSAPPVSAALVYRQPSENVSIYRNVPTPKPTRNNFTVVPAYAASETVAPEVAVVAPVAPPAAAPTAIQPTPEQSAFPIAGGSSLD